MGGWDSVQGRVEAIRWRSAAGRRPWLASAMGPARLAPARVTVGKKERQGEEIRSGRWGPRGRETMSGRWAGGFGGLKG
jgi:hypothetical protein